MTKAIQSVNAFVVKFANVNGSGSASANELFTNIISVGALSALLDVDPLVIAELIGEQYRGKETLLKPNLNALQLGRTYALEHLDCPLGIRVRRLKGEANAVGEKIFIEGNAAAALGCIYGGATWSA